MPAYNSAPWIEAAIRSVMAQSFTDWQLIVVDDGSTDDTPRIVESLAEEDRRISMLATDHLGVANARNVGLENISGDRVAFIDSDDLWPPYNLEALSYLMDRFDADIAAGSFTEFDDENGKIPGALSNHAKYLDDDKILLLTGEEAVEDSLYQRHVMTSLWGKLYRSSLFSGLKTTIGELYEDLDLFYRVALRARKVAYTPLPLYFYRQRDNSIIHTFTPDRLCVLDVTTRICNLLSEKYPALYDAAIDRRFSANYDMLRLINICLRNRTHNEKVGATGNDYERKGAAGNDYEKERAEKERNLFLSKREQIRQFLSLHASKELRNGNVRLKNRLGALLFLLLPFPILNFFLSYLKK